MNINKNEVLSGQIGPAIINSAMDLFLNDDPFLVLNSTYDVIYYNDTFKYSILFNHFLSGDSRYFSDLKENLLLFSTSSFNFSTLNVTLNEKESNQDVEYLININKVRLPQSELYFLKFIDTTKLLERENRVASIQTALEMMKIPVMITSSKGNVIYVSEEFEKTLNLNLESIHNKFFCLAFENLLSSEDRLALENSFFNSQPWNKTIQTFSNIGKTNYKEIKLIPSARLINGEKLSLVIIYDITSHIEKKLEAEETAEKIKSVLNSISDPVFIVKDTKNYLALEIANKSFFELFNCNHTNVGSNIELIVDKELFNLVKTQVGLLQNSKLKSKDFEYSTNGSFFKAKIAAMISANQESIFIITLHNITSEIEYQNKIKAAYKKEMDLNRLKGAFIENISHEIRTPFHAISGYSEIIDESLQKEDYGTVQEITALLKDVLGRVTRLFDNLLELSQLESREMIFDFSNVNPNKVVKNVYDNLIKRAIEKGIQLLLDLGDFQQQIRVDKNKLEKTILSLVDNSIKYTHYGSVVVRTYHKDNKIYISVTDTGEGMNQNEIDDLLQPFNQEEDAFTRKYQGMGLGLTLANRLTKLMGGEVEIVSQKSVGTKITLSFNVIEV